MGGRQGGVGRGETGEQHQSGEHACEHNQEGSSSVLKQKGQNRHPDAPFTLESTQGYIEAEEQTQGLRQ